MIKHFYTKKCEVCLALYIFTTAQMLQDDNLACLQSFGALFDNELYLLIFFQGAVSAGLDGRVMDKNVFITVIMLNEAEALFRIKPFYSALNFFGHNTIIPFMHTTKS